MRHQRDYKAMARSWVRDAEWQAANADRVFRQGAWSFIEDVQIAQRAAADARLDAENAKRFAGAIYEGHAEPRPLLAAIIRCTRRAVRSADIAWDAEPLLQSRL